MIEKTGYNAIKNASILNAYANNPGFVFLKTTYSKSRVCIHKILHTHTSQL